MDECSGEEGGGGCHLPTKLAYREERRAREECQYNMCTMTLVAGFSDSPAWPVAAASGVRVAAEVQPACLLPPARTASERGTETKLINVTSTRINN